MSKLSIRVKLLIVFMVLFTVAYAGAFAWFYQYATNMAMDHLRQNLMVAAETAANLINPDELMQVYNTGTEGDAQYEHIAAQLRMVRDGNALIESIYTMVRSPNANELIFVVSGSEDVEGRAHLREPYDITGMPEMLQGFDGLAADKDYGSDEFGSWLSGYAPVRDATGASVAIVGVDMTADEVIKVQDGVRNVSIIAFVIAYIIIAIGAFFLSGSITRSLRQITKAAQSLESGEKYEPEQLANVASSKDEIGQLARVFDKMAVQIQAREQALKQQVVQLTLEIDEIKRGEQVREIVANDSFKDLAEKARELRRKRAAGEDTTT